MTLKGKLKKIIRPRAFLFKLVLTVLVLICIPLLILQIFVVDRTTNEFEKSNQEYYFSILQASADTFASREQLLSQTAWRLSLDEVIQKPLHRNATEYSLYEAAMALTEYGTEILYVKQAGVYYADKGYLLTGEYKYELSEYCKRKEPANEECAAEMEAFFRELTYLGYYACSDGKTLYLAQPITLASAGKKDAIAFFVMDTVGLEESYRISVSYDSSFAIVDDQGAFLIKGEDFDKNIKAETLLSIASGASGIYTAGAEEELLIYKYIEPVSNFAFLLCVDRDESQENIMDFAHSVRITMYVVLFLMCASLVLTIYINYRPIHRLLKKYTQTGEDCGPYSEIERLESAFFKLDKRNATQQELLVEFILSDLLFDNTVNTELVDQYFPVGKYSGFVVMTTLCPQIAAAQARMVTESVSQATGHSIYVTNVPSRPHTVIICLGEKTIDAQQLCSCAEKALEELLGQRYPVCAGEVVANIYSLRTSYRSAMTANQEITGIEPGANSGEFTKKLQILSQCVYVGDRQGALNQLETIKNFLFTKTVGEGHLRYYGFKLLHAYLTSINSTKSPLSGQEVERLLSFTGMEHLFSLLSESIQQACNRVLDTERSADLRMQKRLLQYVDENFTSSEMCLTAAADYIGTSIYAVSRLFKEATGKGFKDYVTEKRLEYGHALLNNTPKSIAEIAAESGFENANYFSTVFKQKYGMPPTKYRNIQKEDETP